ncbi:aminotransferase class V-fold PLP-dependent enzyme [Qipengyuania soli]
MEVGFDHWANSSSPHAEGRKARAMLEDARERVKTALKWDGEVIFTSGASEATDIAFDYTDVLFQFASAVEHDAISHRANYMECESVPVGRDGAVEFEWLTEAKMPVAGSGAGNTRRSLLALQQVNSETGNRQDIESARSLCGERQGLLLVDCAQSAGKFHLPRCDLAIVSAHKFGGPIGVGALLVKDFAMLRPSGGQERGYRRGTENLPGVLGMAAALEACADPYVASEVLEPLEELADKCRKIGGSWLSDRLSDPTPYIRAVAMPNMSATAQVMRFDMAGIAVSQGSACSSGTMKTSRVLEAMQVEPEVAANTIRVSVGWNTTRAEVERFCEVWLEMAKA